MLLSTNHRGAHHWICVVCTHIAPHPYRATQVFAGWHDPMVEMSTLAGVVDGAGVAGATGGR